MEKEEERDPSHVTATLPTGPDAACWQTCALTAGRGKSGEGEVARREELTA